MGKRRRASYGLLLLSSVLLVLLLYIGMSWGSVAPEEEGPVSLTNAGGPDLLAGELGRGNTEKESPGPLGSLWEEDWAHLEEKELLTAAAAAERPDENIQAEKPKVAEKPAPKPEKKPEPKPEPEPEPEPDPELQPEPKPAPEPEPEPEPQPEPETKLYTVQGSGEARMLELINQERQKAGVSPLTMHKKLRELARLKSVDMFENNYFSHTSPKYGSPFDMMKDNGISYWSAAENIAKSYSVDSAHANLMKSDGHRKNILNPNFDHIGIGVIKGNCGTYYITQMFIQER